MSTQKTVSELANKLEAIKTTTYSTKFIQLKTDSYANSLLKAQSLINVCRGALYGISEKVVTETDVQDVYYTLTVANNVLEQIYWDIEVLDDLANQKQ